MASLLAVRAGLLTTAGLLAGTLIGSALQNWLRIDIVPIGVSVIYITGQAAHVLSAWIFLTAGTSKRPTNVMYNTSTEPQMSLWQV